MDVYGVIGWPIKRIGLSKSPEMHNAAFEKIGRKDKAKYIKIPVAPDQLEGFLLGKISVKDIDGNPIHAGQVKGFNITLPYKVRAREILKEKKFRIISGPSSYPYYDEVSGAINTVKRNGADIEYCNTDPIGFCHSLMQDLKFERTNRKSVLLIGCGGAGRAVVSDLSSEGNHISKIYIYDADEKTVDFARKHFFNLPNRRDYLKRIIKFISEKDMRDTIKKCHLLVNASPVGMKDGDDVSVVDKSILELNKELYVYDVVYNRETGLIKTAKSLEMKAVGGRGMLASQGAFSFSLWTGIRPIEVVDIMRKALDNALENK